jgi:hypothetical protein
VTPLSSIKEFVYLSARGCPEPVMNQAVLEAAKDFHKKTLLWRIELPSINIVKDQLEYPITIPSPIQSDAKIEKIIWAKIENYLIPGQTAYYLKDDESAIVLVDKPSRNITNGLSIMVAFNLKNTATQLDDLIYSRHRATIAERAKQYILSEKDKPYSDTERAAVCRMNYMVGVEKALLEVNKRRGTGDMSVRPNPLFW